MSVHQLRDGRWYVQFRNPEYPGSGPKLKREYFGRGPEAERKAREYNGSLSIREYRSAEFFGYSFAEIAQEYINHKAGSMATTTRKNLILKLNSVIVPEIGDILASVISHERMDKYVLKRLNTVKRTTVHAELTYIMAILNFAVKRKYLSHNPLAGYEKPRRDDEIILPVTLEECRAILANSPPHLLRALVISYYTGLRPGLSELLRLKWSAVDWTAMTFTVISARKGGLKSRAVPVHPDFYDFLKKWHDADAGKQEYIIIWKGKPVKSIKKAFNTAKRKAGISRRLTPYAFRHAFVTGLLAVNGDLKSVSELVGHSRPDTTLRQYQHTDTDLHRQTIHKLPAI